MANYVENNRISLMASSQSVCVFQFHMNCTFEIKDKNKNKQTKRKKKQGNEEEEENVELFKGEGVGIVLSTRNQEYHFSTRAIQQNHLDKAKIRTQLVMFMK